MRKSTAHYRRTLQPTPTGSTDEQAVIVAAELAARGVDFRPAEPGDWSAGEWHAVVRSDDAE
ncbi:hypothetical protein [Nocardiopsis potens]|uniref:hypothetical protein n=1 Tax=Nocardiopsis potens TaxID=1246458 RepID=UPI001267BA06|nr:hypothetical protein [Nocardiopsis potens]